MTTARQLYSHPQTKHHIVLVVFASFRVKIQVGEGEVEEVVQQQCPLSLLFPFPSLFFLSLLLLLTGQI